MGFTGRGIAINRNTGDRAEIYGTSARDIANSAAQWVRGSNPPGATVGSRAGTTTSNVPGFGSIRVTNPGNTTSAAWNARNANGGFTQGYGHDTELGKLKAGTHASQMGPNAVVQNGIIYGANGKQTTAPPGYPGSTGGSGSGGAAGVANPAGIRSQVESAISSNLRNPGISEATIQGNVNKTMDRMTEAQSSAKLAAREAAESSGFGESGAVLSNLAQIDNQSTVNKAAAEKDIRNDAANRNAGAMNTAINSATNYVDQAQRANERAQATAAANAAASAAALPPGAVDPYEAEFGGGSGASGWMSGSTRRMGPGYADQYASSFLRYPPGLVA